MSKIKRYVTGNFTTVVNEFLQDMNLSLTDRGLLMTMLSLPDGWDFSIKGLTAILPDGKAKIGESLKRLEKFGYLKRERIYEDGKVSDWEYIFSDCPVFTRDIIEEISDDSVEELEIKKETQRVVVQDKFVPQKECDKKTDEDIEMPQIEEAQKTLSNPIKSTRTRKSENRSTDLEPENRNLGKTQNLEPDFQELENQDDNKILNNKIYNINNNQSIYKFNNKSSMDRKRITKNDIDSVIGGIHTQINYDKLCSDNPDEKDILDTFVNVMANVALSNKEEYKINGNILSSEVVQQQFASITSKHVQYVLSCMKDSMTSIKNIKAYIITSLYNAPKTMSVYYHAQSNSIRNKNDRQTEDRLYNGMTFKELEKRLLNKS